jgi:uncharacterized membrane protein YdjX (TVP38/TMEM64 family)
MPYRQIDIRFRKPLLQMIIVLALLGTVLIGTHPDALEPAGIRDFILGFGLLAPLAYIALYAVAVFIPYATTILTVVAGLAFGTLWGGVLTYFVTLVASLAPMGASRYLGRPWIEPWVGKSRVRHVARLINRNGFMVFLYLRLIPFIPYEIQNYIAGVSRISYRHFLLASALGNAPIILIMTFFGDSLTQPGSAQFWWAGGVYLVVLLTPVPLALLRRRRRRRRLVH